jgi:molybdenum cofactor biosynthesis enzyme MoaA
LIGIFEPPLVLITSLSTFLECQSRQLTLEQLTAIHYMTKSAKHYAAEGTDQRPPAGRRKEAATTPAAPRQTTIPVPQGRASVDSFVLEPFCVFCARHLTADGKLVTCLFSDHRHDSKTQIRSGATDEELIEIIRLRWSKRTDRYSDEPSRR